MKPALFLLAAVYLALAAQDDAKLLPDGPGKELVAHTCLDCHDSGSFRKKRQDRDAWGETVGQMVDQGAQATEKEQAAIVDYLLQNFGPDSKVRINTAPFSEIRVVLTLSNDDTKAIMAYREQHGAFKQWSDLLNVPGLDAKKVEGIKDSVAF